MVLKIQEKFLREFMIFLLMCLFYEELAVLLALTEAAHALSRNVLFLGLKTRDLPSRCD